jgi:hypothetical protein
MRFSTCDATLRDESHAATLTFISMPPLTEHNEQMAQIKLTACGLHHHRRPSS